MRILISGGTGLIGRTLSKQLRRNGDEMVALSRQTSPGAVAWNPETGAILAGSMEGFDAVIHLAGEPIAEGRWTSEKKERILDSRVRGTRNLAICLAGLARPPKTLVSASAVGFYGNRGDEVLDENAAGGTGFLPEVCRAWEQSTTPAADAGIRIVHARFAAVLDASGGMLGKLKIPFSLGLGGPLGDGAQWLSWIAAPDAAGALRHLLLTLGLSGPVNVTSPNPVTNGEFTATLAKALRRPAILRVPAPVARVAFGEMADAVLLASSRVRPEALLSTGFRFEFPELAPALRAMLAS